MIPSRESLLPFALYTYGRVEVQFSTSLGIDIPAEMLTVRPRVSLEVLARDGVLEDVLAVIDWAFAQTLPTRSTSRS